MIHVTGNTVIDALFYSKHREPSRGSCRASENAPSFLSQHTEGIMGKPLEDICTALTMLLDAHPELWMVVPMHKRPLWETIRKYLENRDKVILCDPLDYPDFVWAMNASKFILSDSGGVQEEASAIKKPVLILRDVTERPEAVENRSDPFGSIRRIYSPMLLNCLKMRQNWPRSRRSADHSPSGTGPPQLRSRMH